MSDDRLDIDAYCRRIGHDGPRAPTLPVLRALIARHATSIPFENIDVVLGRPIRLDPASLQRKMIEGRRGGYCFEQNSLLLAALRGLGFQVTGLMGRVVRGMPVTAATPRTHMTLRVDLPEGAFLADVGFGNLTPTAPLALDSDQAQPTPHETYRLGFLADEHLLQARLGDAWEGVYRFPDQAQLPIDYEVGNWFTSTRPGGLFVENVVVALAGAGCRKTLFNGRFGIRAVRSGCADASPVDDLGALLAEHFGITLDPADLAALAEAMARRREAGAMHPAFT